MAKKKIICDTDVMIDYWDKVKPRHSSTKATLEKSIELDNIVLSAITKMELMLGAINKTDMATITSKLNRFNIALIDSNITLSRTSRNQIGKALPFHHGITYSKIW